MSGLECYVWAFTVYYLEISLQQQAVVRSKSELLLKVSLPSNESGVATAYDK